MPATASACSACRASCISGVQSGSVCRSANKRKSHLEKAASTDVFTSSNRQEEGRDGPHEALAKTVFAGVTWLGLPRAPPVGELP